MQVGAWGQAEYDAAKTLASAGDEQFLKENFEAALVSYDAAAVALAALIDTGAQLLAKALEDGETALLERNETSAREHFEFALTIDPDNEQARHGAQRADLLPEVIVLLRQGKNHELSGNWTEALATYQTVEKIDPATAGLGEALATARTGVVALRFREHLSDGFAAMQANRFEQARSAFNKALALKPGNSVALGGLEQVSQRTDLSRIESLKQEAIAAEAREEWPAAITGYEAVLALDTNIQFAKDGRARAATQYRTGQALGKIIASPDKLSSPRLFNEAKNILARAEQLSPRKENLAAQINSVHNLISIYSVPVEVTFHSDNATNVTLSTVGVLGAFAEKRVTLRPGAYTVIGSRDGCRDVRESIVVRPEMQPIDIRCVETF
jgi:tetratricopeptide (TPR) repeat protein